MKNYNCLGVSLTVLDHFPAFLLFCLLFGQFCRYLKVLENREIQDGGSKMAAVHEHAAFAELKGKSFRRVICLLSFDVIALISVLGIEEGATKKPSLNRVKMVKRL